MRAAIQWTLSVVNMDELMQGETVLKNVLNIMCVWCEPYLFGVFFFYVFLSVTHNEIDLIQKLMDMHCGFIFCCREENLQVEQLSFGNVCSRPTLVTLCQTCHFY